MIRMIATDVDGTLYSSHRKVSEQNKSAILAAREQGIVVCLASGRYLKTITMVAEEAELRGPLVTCNGAFVIDEKGHVVADNHVSTAAQDMVLDYAEMHSVQANIYQPNQVFANGDGEMYRLYCERTKASCLVVGQTEMRQLKATKLIFIDSPSRISVHKAHFESISADLDCELTTSEPEYLEFLPRGVTKGTGLQALASHMNLSASEVAAIGDYHNDLEMVQWAGFGAAVGNAIDELKNVADVVVPTNNESGLAVFIDLVLQRNAVERENQHRSSN